MEYNIAMDTEPRVGLLMKNTLAYPKEKNGTIKIPTNYVKNVKEPF